MSGPEFILFGQSNGPWLRETPAAQRMTPAADPLDISDQAAQDWVEGRRAAAPGLIGWLVASGMISVNTARLYRLIWKAIEAKQRRRSGWGRP